MMGPATSPFTMRPANELVAEGFERARVARLVRGQADSARRLLDQGKIDAAAGGMFVRWCEALTEMIEQRLFDEEIDPRRVIGGEG